MKRRGRETKRREISIRKCSLAERSSFETNRTLKEKGPKVKR